MGGKEIVELTQKDLKKLLSYNPETGEFFWLEKGSGRNISKQAGHSFKASGELKYRFIMINGKRYLAHRLAWLYFYGEPPINMIDHINGNGLDNRINNLRDVDLSTNLRNQKKARNNTSGFTGVFYNRAIKKWYAQIHINNKTKCLGYFKYKKDAIEARKLANAKYGYHQNHGRSLSG